MPTQSRVYTLSILETDPPITNFNAVFNEHTNLPDGVGSITLSTAFPWTATVTLTYDSQTPIGGYLYSIDCSYTDIEGNSHNFTTNTVDVRFLEDKKIEDIVLNDGNISYIIFSDDFSLNDIRGSTSLQYNQASSELFDFRIIFDNTEEYSNVRVTAVIDNVTIWSKDAGFHESAVTNFFAWDLPSKTLTLRYKFWKPDLIFNNSIVSSNYNGKCTVGLGGNQ